MASQNRMPSPETGPIHSEVATLDRIGTLLHQAHFVASQGELWFGDDAAVLNPLPSGHQVVFCTDAGVAGVHSDPEFVDLEDLGWRTTMATLSDLAAMGADPWCLVATVGVPPDGGVEAMMAGVIAAAKYANCPVVGGDLTSSTDALVSLAALGHVPSGQAVSRSGGSPGDAVMATGVLGASAAGLRLLRQGHGGDHGATLRHRRPQALLAQGRSAREGGASAMIDISDGLSLDLHRLADASNVGFVLDSVPIADEATREEALSGGEDFELLITTSDAQRLITHFEKNALKAPIRIGTLIEDPTLRQIEGHDDLRSGFTHEVA